MRHIPAPWRQLTQAALSGVRPIPEVLALGVWVDAVHAMTALALAGILRSRARAGLTDTTVAALWAAVGYRDLAGGQGMQNRGRDRIGRTVAVAAAPDQCEAIRGGWRVVTCAV